MLKKALLISCFDWYDKRLKLIQEVLKNKYDVTIAMSDFDHIQKKKIEQLKEGCIYIEVPKYKRNISIQRMLSHFVFGRKIGRILSEVEPDLVYLMLPPNNIARYCLKYKKRNPHVKYVIDVIDMWPESMPIKGFENNLISKQWAMMRNESLERADYVITECDLYRERLAGFIHGKNKTVYLYKEQSIEESRKVLKFISAASKSEGDSLKISLGYIGSINNVIDIELASSIVSYLVKKGYDVVVNIIGDGESKDTFLNCIEEAGAEVVYYGKIFDENKKIDILAKCDFGLNLMKESVSVGLTIKSMDYFSCGLPVINNIKGDTWHMVETNRVGVNIKYEEKYEESFLDMFSRKNISELKNNAYKLYRENFTVEKYKQQIINIMNEMEME